MVIFGVGYMFFIRPRSQAARRQRDTLIELSPGDEVLTGAGIFGTVLDVESDRVTLETAPGTRITVLRSTIARRITDPATETPNWDEHDEDEAHGAYHQYEHSHDDGDHELEEHAGPEDEADAHEHDAEAEAEQHDGAEAHDGAEVHDGADVHDGAEAHDEADVDEPDAEDKNKT